MTKITGAQFDEFREESRVLVFPAGEQTFVSYDECVRITRAARVTTKTGYAAWERPEGVPSHPDMVYAGKGWVNWKVFLGTGTTVYVSHSRCRNLARAAGLKTSTEYQAWKRPEGVPCEPHVVYAGRGWKSWGDFLGTHRVQNGDQEFVSYAKCRRLARAAGIKRQCEYHAWKKPQGVPSNPDKIYDSWVSWNTFLGTTPRANAPVSYLKCRRLARATGIKTWEDYRRWERPLGVPSNPNAIYAGKGWVDWKTFLGTTRSGR